jgi:hypothetical protein
MFIASRAVIRGWTVLRMALTFRQLFCHTNTLLPTRYPFGPRYTRQSFNYFCCSRNISRVTSSRKAGARRMRGMCTECVRYAWDVYRMRRDQFGTVILRWGSRNTSLACWMRLSLPQVRFLALVTLVWCLGGGETTILSVPEGLWPTELGWITLTMNVGEIV